MSELEIRPYQNVAGKKTEENKWFDRIVISPVTSEDMLMIKWAHWFMGHLLAYFQGRKFKITIIVEGEDE